MAGENPSHGGSSTSSSLSKFYAVKSGRIPGIYTDWPSAQEQITGWKQPKHKCFTTRVEAQRFLDGDEQRVPEAVEMVEGENGSSVTYHASEGPTESTTKAPAPKKTKKSSKVSKVVVPEYNEADYEPGTGPLPPGAEDGFDPNITLDKETGQVIYKTIEQRQATRLQATGGGQNGMIRIHTDGSSLRNGADGALAGVGVYFGPNDERYGSIEQKPYCQAITDIWAP